MKKLVLALGLVAFALTIQPGLAADSAKAKPPSSNIQNANEKVDWFYYKKNIGLSIPESHRFYGKTLSATAKFTLARDGRLLSYKLVKPSGNKTYDDAVLSAITVHQRLSPLPQGSADSETFIWTANERIYNQYMAQSELDRRAKVRTPVPSWIALLGDDAPSVKEPGQKETAKALHWKDLVALYGPESNEIAEFYKSCAELLRHSILQYDIADKVQLEAKRIFEKNKNYSGWSSSLICLSSTAGNRGDKARQFALVKEAAEVLRKGKGPDDEQYILTINGLANMQKDSGELASAAENYSTVVAWFRKHGRLNDAHNLFPYVSLASTHIKLRDFPKAEQECNEILALYLQNAPGQADFAYSVNADLKEAQGRSSEAAAFRKKGEEINRRRHGNVIICK